MFHAGRQAGFLPGPGAPAGRGPVDLFGFLAAGFRFLPGKRGGTGEKIIQGSLVQAFRQGGGFLRLPASGSRGRTCCFTVAEGGSPASGIRLLLREREKIKLADRAGRRYIGWRYCCDRNGKGLRFQGFGDGEKPFQAMLRQPLRQRAGFPFLSGRFFRRSGDSHSFPLKLRLQKHRFSGELTKSELATYQTYQQPQPYKYTRSKKTDSEHCVTALPSESL